MKYRREEIMPGVFLSALSTDKFKTAAMSVVLLNRLSGSTPTSTRSYPACCAAGR